MTVLSLTDIQRINTLVKRDLRNVEEVVAATGFDPEDVDAVLRGVYVADLANQWRDEAAITLEEYNAIRKRWKPGRGHWDTAHAIARDFLIRPETVLAIVHSRFSNAHTHPMPKAVKAYHGQKMIPARCVHAHMLLLELAHRRVTSQEVA
ncbi:TPA: hypothetical protein J5G21_004497 [Escherichia coli]|nr:hypothetical protein [Escherichia coli]